MWIVGIYILNKHPNEFYDWARLGNRMAKKSRDVDIWKTWARDLIPSPWVSYSKDGLISAWGWPITQQGTSEAP